MGSGRKISWSLTEEQREELRSRVLSEKGHLLEREFRVPYYVVQQMRAEELERKLKEDRAEKLRKQQEAKDYEVRQAELWTQKRFEEYGYRFEELTGEERMIYLRGPKHRLEGKVLVMEKGA
jgi:negative regulator of sigma E activity